MATDFVQEDGSYNKSVPDDQGGQNKAKFGNFNGKTTDNLPKPSQKSGTTTDGNPKQR